MLFLPGAMSASASLCSDAICIEAASLGILPELDRLRYLRDLSLWSKDVWTAAAAHGQVEVLDWLRCQEESVYFMDPEACVVAAAQNGHAHVSR